MNANNRFEAAREAAMQLDLTPIKAKLMHVASGEGWSQEKADAVEREYRRFLCLSVAFPGESIAPLADVDIFWHYHILDTMKYATDCQQAFGYFLHHYPYLGLDGEESEQARIDTGERTRKLYEAMFGEAYTEPVPAMAWCAGPTAPLRADAPAMAWCAGPTAPLRADTPAIAWCAGPTARMTWRASPGGQTLVAPH
jgi:hypothetical protein